MAGVIAEQTPEQKAGIRNTLVVTVGIICVVLGAIRELLYLSQEPF